MKSSDWPVLNVFRFELSCPNLSYRLHNSFAFVMVSAPCKDSAARHISPHGTAVTVDHSHCSYTHFLAVMQLYEHRKRHPAPCFVWHNSTDSEWQKTWRPNSGSIDSFVGKKKIMLCGCFWFLHKCAFNVKTPIKCIVSKSWYEMSHIKPIAPWSFFLSWTPMPQLPTKRFISPLFTATH